MIGPRWRPATIRRWEICRCVQTPNFIDDVEQEASRTDELLTTVTGWDSLPGEPVVRAINTPLSYLFNIESNRGDMIIVDLDVDNLFLRLVSPTGVLVTYYACEIEPVNWTPNV